MQIVTGEETEVLRTKAGKVKDPTAPEIRALIPEMIETMRKAEGVGLAAPQVGIPLRFCVVEVEEKVSVYFNPKITARSKEKVIFEEGCLSLPGQFFPIERHKEVTIRYNDADGQPKKLRAKGFLAIVLQHEIDHLEGILIVNRYRKQNNQNIYAL